VKHPTTDRLSVQRVLRWLNLDMSEQQWTLLEDLARWLITEAIPAGGLGPDETERIWARHLADSVAFAQGWPSPPSHLVDIGSGAGLPGLPLAILWPNTEVTLLDRSQRKTDLARRAIRVVGIDNAVPLGHNTDTTASTWPAATMRAVANPQKALFIADRVVDMEGSAVVGLRGPRPELSTVPPGRRVSIVDVPGTVLDGPVSLLIMCPRGH
jgi:16S rRNA (guanine527-N7)-methyltransferase